MWIQLLRCQYVSGQPALRLVSHVFNFQGGVLFDSRVECDLLCHLATTRCPPGVQEIAAQYMYIHRGCGGKLFVECTFWLVKAEPLIRSRVALRIYVQPIRILFLILMNVLEVKVRIAASESMTFADIELCIENLVHKTACLT